jgi:hypothetical protein
MERFVLPLCCKTHGKVSHFESSQRHGTPRAALRPTNPIYLSYPTIADRSTRPFIIRTGCFSLWLPIVEVVTVAPLKPGPLATRFRPRGRADSRCNAQAYDWADGAAQQRVPPRGIGSQVPSSRKRCTHRIAELTLTSNCSAAPRRDPPPSTKSTTRVLNSPGYGLCIGQPSGESMR